jgi:hypothetical protein
MGRAWSTISLAGTRRHAPVSIPGNASDTPPPVIRSQLSPSSPHTDCAAPALLQQTDARKEQLGRSTTLRRVLSRKTPKRIRATKRGDAGTLRPPFIQESGDSGHREGRAGRPAAVRSGHREGRAVRAWPVTGLRSIPETVLVALLRASELLNPPSRSRRSSRDQISSRSALTRSVQKISSLLLLLSCDLRQGYCRY